MCAYNSPFQHEVYRSCEMNEILNNFDNYETNVEKIDINDNEAVRSILREIPLDDYQPSKSNSELLESAKRNGETIKQSTVTEDEMAKLIQRLHSKNNSKGLSNLEYMANYKPQSAKGQAIIKNYEKILREEKVKMNEEYLEEERNRYFSEDTFKEIDNLK